MLALESERDPAVINKFRKLSSFKFSFPEVLSDIVQLSDVKIAGKSQFSTGDVILCSIA